MWKIIGGVLVGKKKVIYMLREKISIDTIIGFMEKLYTCTHTPKYICNEYICVNDDTTYSAISQYDDGVAKFWLFVFSNSHI